jgi:tetratricopeptide (TPR) repeat protein/CHAT domain-containing protein
VAFLLADPCRAEDLREARLRQLHEQAHLLAKSDRNGEAIVVARQAVELSEEIHGVDDPGNSESLYRLARLYCREGQYAQAEPLYRRVLESAEKKLGSGHPETATALLNFGWYYANLARYTQARVLFQRALAIREKHFGRSHRATAECLNSLAVLLENTGRYAEAEPLYQEALQIQEKVLGPEHPSTATTLNNLASLYWILGDLDQAERDFTRALRIREAHLGWQHPDTMTSLNNLALLQQSMGDYSQAEPLFKRVLENRRKILGPNHAFTLTSMSHLGRLYADMGDDTRAEPLLRKALEYRERTISPDHPDTARNLNDLAALYDRIGQPDKAGPLYERALAGRQKTLGPHHSETAASMYGLACHYHRQRRLAEAEPLYWEALKIQQTALGDVHPETLRTREAFAYLMADMEQADQARDLAREVIEGQEERLRRLFTFASERQRLEFRKTLSLVSVAANLGRPSDLAETILRTKGLVLDSSLEDRVALQAAQDSETQSFLNELRLVTRRLLEIEADSSAEASAGTASTGPTERDQLDERRKQLESAISRRTTIGGRARRALATSLSDLQGALTPHTVLVEFVRYQQHLGALRFEPHYGAMLISRDGEPLWVPLGKAEDIDNQVHLYQRYVRRRVRIAALTRVVRALERQVWQPVGAALPSGTQAAIISPDSELNFVSFAALVLPDNRFLAEQLTVRYVTSGRDLLERPSRRTPQRNLVVIANPPFSLKPASARKEPSGDQLTPMPGARKEASSLMKKAAGWGLTATSYDGKQATEETVTGCRSPWILHFATHGLYLSESSVMGRALRDPMQRSVLALAGAQTTLDAWAKGRVPPEPDGLLTATEVASLNLQGTWLTVLSACDTGIGEARTGEGVLGLRRGFIQAGTRNLLITLWPVADTESAQIILDFYAEALRTMNAPQAIGDIQRNWLVKLRREGDLAQAIRLAGPFVLSYQGQ